MKSYIVQIDSLNTLNHQLTADAAAARREAAESRAANENSRDRFRISGQVAAGAVIKSRGLSVAAYNASDKVTDRSSRVIRLLTTLSLVENEIAPRGPVRVYLRVKDPDGILLTNTTHSFNFNGQPIVASASREVDYQGQEVELSIYLNDILPTAQASTLWRLTRSRLCSERLTCCSGNCDLPACSVLRKFLHLLRFLFGDSACARAGAAVRGLCGRRSCGDRDTEGRNSNEPFCGSCRRHPLHRWRHTQCAAAVCLATDRGIFVVSPCRTGTKAGLSRRAEERCDDWRRRAPKPQALGTRLPGAAAKRRG